MRRAALIAAAGALLFAPSLASAAGSGSFSPTGSLLGPSEDAGAARLPDGRALIAGGDNHTSSALGTAEIFDPGSGTFTATGNLGTPRSVPVAAPLPDGRVLVAGGWTGGPVLTSAEVFDPQTGTFSSSGIGPMTIGRRYAVAVPLLDGRVLIAGGCSGAGCNPLASAEVFDPQTKTFSNTGIGSMGVARTAPGAARLPDGRVLIAGGYDGSDELASVEIFNPQTNSFSSAGVGSMAQKRSDLIAAPLPDGRVLVAGGFADGQALNSAEVFDPQTNSFSSAGIGSLGAARGDASGVALQDGRVLVAGGYGTDFLQTAEIYSATNTFSLSLTGKTLAIGVTASGKVSVSDAASPLSVSAAKKKKRRSRLLLNPSSGSGDPPTISVPLSLSKLARQKLRAKGKLTVTARITFTPDGGLANTQTAALRIKGKKKRK